jgi:hypothetical protein
LASENEGRLITATASARTGAFACAGWPAELLAVFAHDRGSGSQANADGAALVDKGTLGGYPPDDILGVNIAAIPLPP